MFLINVLYFCNVTFSVYTCTHTHMQAESILRGVSKNIQMSIDT